MVIVITAPCLIEDEGLIVNELFANGLHVLHLRKPGAGREVFERFIEGVAPRFRERIVVHDYFDLVEAYGLRGIHVKAKEALGLAGREAWGHVSVSCHSLEEVGSLGFRPDYVFLSPVFDSISKWGYEGAFEEEGLREGLRRLSTQVVALGGVTDQNVAKCRELGFAGVALLGYLWEAPGEAVHRFTRVFPGSTLSIAGFDPSSGAGVTADIKTFECCRVYGLGVASSITFQNQKEYRGTKWMTTGEMMRQCEVLFREFSPAYVKIGLIESFEALGVVVDYLVEALPGVKIVWDPILKASAGFEFHAGRGFEGLKDVLKKIYLITPNAEELGVLLGDAPEVVRLQAMCRELGLNILWKGGHNEEALARDRLITSEGVFTFSVARGKHGKHGTGCVLSAAIVSYLTLGYSLVEACRYGQRYVSDFIRSNDTSLGMHREPGKLGMPVNLFDFKLQYITDYKEGMTIPEQVEAVCRGGCRWVQLRMKGASREELMRTGRVVKEICRGYGALFLVNDHVDVALELDADGVHLGKEDASPLEARRLLGYTKVIGGTCNTFEDVWERCREQVDYVGLGPFRYTTTKGRLSPVLGLEGYREIMGRCAEAGVSVPVYAIGGIREDDLRGILDTGVAGVALSSLLKGNEDVRGKTEEVVGMLGA